MTEQIQNEECKDLISELSNKRKVISQKLMKNIHGLYTFQNFRKQKKAIHEIFYSEKGIPTATGDCCAPKLLNYAAKNQFCLK